MPSALPIQTVPPNFTGRSREYRCMVVPSWGIDIWNRWVGNGPSSNDFRDFFFKHSHTERDAANHSISKNAECPRDRGSSMTSQEEHTMHCPACSTENPVGATFCQHCGASLSSAPPAAGGYTQVPPPPGPGTPASGYPPPAGYVPAQSGLSDNAAAAIAYLTFIPAVIFLVMEPYSRRPFVRFHAVQCLGLTVASLVLHFAVGLLVFALHGAAVILSSLVSLVFFILWLVCIVSAAQGKWFKVPVIGDLAQQQARR